MLFKRKRPSKSTITVQKVQLVLNDAQATLVEALVDDIALLNNLMDQSDADKNIENYPKRSLARVMLAASNYHLKLKLGKSHAAPPDLPFLQYLNPVDPNKMSFASTCKRVYKELEDSDLSMVKVHWTELRNVYVYLLSRIE